MRELKSVDITLHDVPRDATPEEKLIVLHRSYVKLQSENEEGQLKAKQADKRVLSILGERDKFQNELARVLQQKEKLESLCRELQKQNHQIKEESMQMAESEDKQRKAVADRFQASILDIQKQLGEYLNKNKELREENQQLAEKLHNFIKDHEGREEHVKKLIKTRELEAKLAEAKLEQAKVQHQQEQMVSEQKIARLKEESELLNKRLDAHRNVEDKLKEQIDFYKTKYQQFNKTISNSNHMFETAKTEMEKMTKHVRAAEAQALDWRAKWEVSQQTLLETADALKQEQGKVASLTRQVDSLSSLCRALRGNQSRSSNATEQVTPTQPQATAAKVVSDASAVSPAGDRTTVASDLAGESCTINTEREDAKDDNPTDPNTESSGYVITKEAN
uniref:Alpha-taxilin n=2 Tax=Schistocephalus solidus TaxID=70667 RepID=A0A0V0J6N9_SCHSO